MYQCPQCQDFSLSNSATLSMTLDGSTARRHDDMPDMQDDAADQAQADKLPAYRVYVSSRDPGVIAAGRL